MIEPHQHPRVGWVLTGIGAVMMAVSMVVAQVFSISGIVFHNVMQIGGLALVIVGTLFVAGVFYRGGDE